MSYERISLDNRSVDLTLLYMVQRENERKYKLQLEDNKNYNNGSFKIKSLKKGIAIPIVVGSLVISITLSLFVFPQKLDKIKNFESVSLDSNSLENSDSFRELHAYQEQIRLSLFRKEIIQEYCAIYGVNFDLVYNKIIELTDNFSNENFIKHLTIDGVYCKSTQPYASNEEELFIYAVRAMAQTPEAFGFDSSIRNTSTYVSNSNYLEVIDHYARVFQIDRNLLYAIMAEETQHFTSNIFMTKNNPAGLKSESGDYADFSNLDEGIIESCTELLKYHYLFGASSIEEIGSIHAPVEDNNDDWVPNVVAIFHKITYSNPIGFSLEGYELCQHDEEKVIFVSVDGKMDSYFEDRDLYHNQFGLN